MTNEPASSSVSAAASPSMPTDTSVSKATTVTTDTIGTTSVKAGGLGDSKVVEEEDLKAPPAEDEEDASSTGVVAPLDEEDDLPDFTPPLRIHATRVHERLSGSSSQLQIRENLQQHLKRRKSDPAMHLGSRSRSESPTYRSHRHGGSSTNSINNNNYDAGSSISSLEDMGIDTDILTDKMGVLELDWKTQQEMSQTLNRSLSNLPIVAERASDDMLEDCHAFTDLKREGTQSRGGSITTGGEVSSNVLDTLEEIDELDEAGGGTPTGGAGEKIKITNLEEILEAAEEDGIADGAPTSGATFQSA